MENVLGMLTKDLYKNNGIDVMLWYCPGCWDDVFGSVRSIILTSDPIPDVKSTFATLSIDESHINSNVTSKSSKSRSNAFAARSENKNSLKSDESYDDGGDSVEISSKFAPKTSTQNSNDSTVEEAASNKNVQTDKSNTIDITGSTYIRKVISENEYATETGVSEGIQGTELNDDEYESEGEDIESFGHLFGWSPEPAVGQTVRRSSRKTSISTKYQDYVLDKNVKFGIDKVVNYSNLSMDNFVFSNSINKIHEPTTYHEAVKDIRWIEAMNQEIEALIETILSSLLIYQPRSTPIESNPYRKKLVSKFGDHDALTVHCLSQVILNPLKSHLKFAFRVLRYLKRAPGCGITSKETGDNNLRIFVDFDWAKCKITRRSITRSSTEAEFKAMCNVCCEVIWIKKILTDLQIDIDLPIKMNCDNNLAIQISANPVLHERSKDFEIDLYFLREKIASRLIKPRKIKFEDNIADLFTKGLTFSDYNKFCSIFGLFNPFEA
ncbi:ribonuclease H-like domain-containing protein [Tanacetum coccineum]